MKKITDIFDTPRFPHQGSVGIGGGQSLKIRYRAVPQDSAEKCRAFLKEQFAALGLDPDVALKSLGGLLPTGEEGARFEEAFRALGDTGAGQVQDAVLRTNGYELSLVIGGWSLVDEKGRAEPLEDVTAEECAALPLDVQKAIAALAQSATAPASNLDFLGTSLRS